MSNFLWTIFQSGQIGRNHSTATQASVKSERNASDVNYLEDRLDTLSLANQAMWELLSNHLGYTENDLLKKMEEIDMRDGVLDGKITVSAVKNCPECGHTIRKRRANCYWCGAALKGPTTFSEA
ncbi:hypothetical protein D515_04336 [Grimontia indica]|uniref:Zinc ribbon domain-containing protein n=1 Tax=Grimontia indica TaxID=1056512 RepID=R1GZC2_9GAMM|nr:zinc ribbon domain-containing protein [Grimontia indica]EOD81434.1 hypothetical protein D515_04336 [Grimontia indica]